MTLRSITGEALSAAAQKSTFHKPKPYNHTSEAARVKVPSLLCMEGPCRRFSIKRAHFQDKRTVKRLGAGGGRLPPPGPKSAINESCDQCDNLGDAYTHSSFGGCATIFSGFVCAYVKSGRVRARALPSCGFVRTTHMRVWMDCMPVVSRKAVHLRLYGTALQDRV